MLHISGSIYHGCHLWYICVKWYVQVFFSVLKFWFSRLSMDWKCKKWHNISKMSVELYDSGTIYHMIFIYGTHVCIKGSYLQAFLFLLLILIIRIIRWGWLKGRKWPKMTNNFDCLTLYFRNRTSCDCDIWCMFVKWLYLQQIFSFFKILLFGVFRGTKGKKWPNITNFSLFWYISQELEIISSRFW